MTKLKRWLYNKFLPAWCKDDLMDENAALRARLRTVEQDNRELRAYINGIETALRRCGRISINTGVKP